MERYFFKKYLLPRDVPPRRHDLAICQVIWLKARWIQEDSGRRGCCEAAMLKTILFSEKRGARKLLLTSPGHSSLDVFILKKVDGDIM